MYDTWSGSESFDRPEAYQVLHVWFSPGPPYETTTANEKGRSADFIRLLAVGEKVSGEACISSSWQCACEWHK